MKYDSFKNSSDYPVKNQVLYPVNSIGYSTRIQSPNASTTQVRKGDFSYEKAVGTDKSQYLGVKNTDRLITSP